MVKYVISAKEVLVMCNKYKYLLELEDYQLISEICEGIIDEIRNLPSEDDFEKMAEIKFYLLAASTFDMEMQNGGLCQFIVNAGKLHGPLLEKALCVFGAEQHQKLLSQFSKDNNIDFRNLQKLAPGNMDPYSMVDDYFELLAKYPFCDFEQAYYELDRACPLVVILAEYVRENISQFLPH